jgi:hypothetical protein
MRRHFLWLHRDRRGGILGRPLFDAVECHCYELLFYSEVMSLDGFWEALAVRGVRTWTCFCPQLSGRVLKARTSCMVQSECTGGGLFPHNCRNGNNTLKGRKFCRQEFGRAEPFYIIFL